MQESQALNWDRFWVIRLFAQKKLNFCRILVVNALGDNFQYFAYNLRFCEQERYYLFSSQG